ncbi:ATP-binding protein [Agarivorans sp.]|uniref:sensor histidine kinase n=1 Tax=Agarivorans sp. TaxID=1872412 RepID=UPI003D0601A1
MIQFFSSWFHSVNGRLIFFWLLGSLFPVVLLGGTTAYISYYYIREQAMRFASEIAKEKIQSVINLQKPVVSVSSHITSDSNMLDTVFADTSDSFINEIKINALIEDGLAHYFSLDGLSSISLILNEGRSYSLSIEVEMADIDWPEFQQQLTACSTFSESQLCWPGIQNNINIKSQHKKIIPAIKKVYRLNEQTMQEEHIGYLYMAFSTLSYRKMLKQESSDELPLLVVDQNNQVIFYDHSELTGQAVPSNMLPKQNGVPYKTSIDGQPFYLVSHASKISGWRFIILVPEQQILQGMYQTLTIAGTLTLLSLVFILFAWLNVRRRVLKPLQLLSLAMRDNAASRPSYRENKHQLKEIHTLFYWYNKYVDIVEHRDKQAEQLRAAYDELTHTQEQLIESEKMAALGKLVAGVAHEINTPLGVSLTSLSYSQGLHQKLQEQFSNETLKRSDLEKFLEKSQQGVDIAINNLNRASELVKTFKKVASDQHIEELRRFSLADYLANTVTSLEPKLKQQNVVIEWTCDESIILESYPGLLWQVFSNLVMNSLIHGYEHKEKGTISIQVEALSEWVKIVYRDDGCGMSEEVKSSIFMPFYTTKRHTGGTGLGMHIVYNMVSQKLQGSISCESQLGLGTTFEITLPLNAKH